MNIITLNNHRSKMKDWCFKMPNLSYCHRYKKLKKPTMNITNFIIISALVFLIGCNQETTIDNHFSTLHDTLLIKMQQNPGRGFSMKSRSIHKLHFKDSLEYEVIVPDGIENIKLASEISDYNMYGYNQLKTRLINGDTGVNYSPLFEFDTSNILSLKENSVCFLQGELNSEDIFIVDENFNKDFRDDSIRVKKLVDFLSDDDLIKCDFKIFDGKEKVIMSNWIQVGKWKFGKNELYYLANQNYTAEFTINNSSYKLECFIYDARFNFEKPAFSLINFTGIQMDTITDGELLSIDNYLRLKEGDYRIYHLSNDGFILTVVKDNNFEKLDGTQIGMLAPDFNCISMGGDSINFKNYKGKFLLLANVSACSSKISSYKCYKDLANAYKGKMEILCLDKTPTLLRNNIKELNLTGKFIDVNKNEELRNYRPDFCSRTCYLINPEGRIIDKFEIFDWEQTLKKNFARN